MTLENAKDEICKKKKKSKIEIRTTTFSSESSALLTARQHRTLWNTAQNKKYENLQISSRILTRFSRVFLNSGSCGFVIYLPHRKILISHSFKKIGDSVTVHSPCKMDSGPKNGDQQVWRFSNHNKKVMCARISITGPSSKAATLFNSLAVLYCLRYLLLLPRPRRFKSIINVSQTLRQWFGNSWLDDA